MLRNLLDKMYDYRKIVSYVVFFLLPALLFIVGFAAYWLEHRYTTFLPWRIIPALFTRNAGIIFILIFISVISALVVRQVRGAKYAGMERDERNFYLSDKGTYGTAKLMDKQRMRKVFDCVPEKHTVEAEGNILAIKDGLCISRPKDSRLTHNTAVLGSSGTMKTRAVLKNAIIGSARRNESMIITDPKGELFRESSDWLRKKGYNVRVLNLVDMEKSHNWNFLLDALEDAHESDVFNIVEIIASIIISNTNSNNHGTGGGDAFWDKGEKGLLKAIILYQYYSWKAGLEPLTFSFAYNFLLNNDSVEKIEKSIEKLNHFFDSNPALSQFNIFKRFGERLMPNFHSGLLSRLDIFLNPAIERITSGSEEKGIDLILPAKEKCAYFLITSDQDTTYNFFLCLFFALLFIRVVKFADTVGNGKCPVPVNCLLDEFPNIGEIPDFELKMATVRSRDVRITILFQSIPQLEKRYPRGAYYGIISNCDFMMFLGTNDPITADFISKRTGEGTILVETKAEQHSKLNPLKFVLDERDSTGSGKRMLYTPNEVLTMAEDNELAALLIARGQPVLECEKFDYTRNPEAKEWKEFSMMDFDPDAWLEPLPESERIADSSNATADEESDGRPEGWPFNVFPLSLANELFARIKGKVPDVKEVVMGTVHKREGSKPPSRLAEVMPELFENPCDADSAETPAMDEVYIEGVRYLVDGETGEAIETPGTPNASDIPSAKPQSPRKRQDTNIKPSQGKVEPDESTEPRLPKAAKPDRSNVDRCYESKNLAMLNMAHKDTKNAKELEEAEKNPPGRAESTPEAASKRTELPNRGSQTVKEKTKAKENSGGTGMVAEFGVFYDDEGDAEVVKTEAISKKHQTEGVSNPTSKPASEPQGLGVTSVKGTAIKL